MNKAIILGRLGRDPEVKSFATGSVTNFSVATSKKWVKDGETKEKTEWHNIQVWGKLGEVCSQYLTKGKQVLVEGEIETRKYEKEGQNHYATSIKANHVQFLGSASKDSLEMASTPGPSVLPNHAPTIDANEEIPF